MPSALTYPGVYIEEIPSGVRTIIGVATSITAFVGRARKGPTDDPVVISNYGDFERTFGGLWVDSPMSYAVRDFFRNGGGQAIVVRVYNRGEGDGSGAAQIAVSANLTLVAASPGTWGDALRARVDHDVKPGDDSRFNLTIALVRHDGTGKVEAVTDIETFRNVSLVDTSLRRVDKVLAAESRLVRALDFVPVASPATTRPEASAEPTLANPPVPAHPLWGREEGNTTSVGVALPEGGGSDGAALTQTQIIEGTSETDRTGLYALQKADLFNLLCIPPHDRENGIELALIEAAIAYCQKRRAVYLIDPPSTWPDRAAAVTGVDSDIGSVSRNAAVFFPRLRAPDPLQEGQIQDFAPCGAVAGIIARTDSERGVWKAPAGLAATIVGAPDLSVRLTDDDIGQLNPLGVNCLRVMPAAGRVVWGARTREGADRLASEWKYLPVRRLALFIEESLYRGTQWVVFEPNDEPLWAKIRLNLGVFMNGLFRQGAFQGSTPGQAFYVKCDAETTTQADRNLGIVNIEVGFAPLKPAEFVIIKIQQIAGDLS